MQIHLGHLNIFTVGFIQVILISFNVVDVSVLKIKTQSQVTHVDSRVLFQVTFWDGSLDTAFTLNMDP